MFQPPTETRCRDCMEPIGSALEYWKQRLLDLPEVRFKKVQSARRAIGRSSYESEQVLERTLRQLGNDLGVLCRTDLYTGSV